MGASSPLKPPKNITITATEGANFPIGEISTSVQIWEINRKQCADFSLLQREIGAHYLKEVPNA